MMATAGAARRYKSHRRIAALAFLSNISLDGTYKDTKLGQALAQGDTNKTDDTEKHEDQAVPDGQNIEAEEQNSDIGDLPVPGTSSYKTVAHTKSLSAKELRRKSSGDVALPQSDSVTFLNERSSNPLKPHKDRHFRTNSDDIASSTNIKKKRPPYSATLCSGSSSESICTGSRSRKHSGSDETSLGIRGKDVREVRFVKTVRDQAIRDDRIEGRGESRRRHLSGSRPLSTISDGGDILELLGIDQTQETSFCQFLVPSRWVLRPRAPLQDSELTNLSTNPLLMRCLSYNPPSQKGSASHAQALLTPQPVSEKESDDEDDQSMTLSPLLQYSPNLLDNPELIVASRRKNILAFTSYRTSIIDFIRPVDIKKEVNDKFREKFPFIQVTLSKLRSIKREMRKVAQQECEIDMLTVAQAYVFFEKLILKCLITKQNRKLCAGACLLLSAKMNDVKGPDLKELIEKAESVFRVNRKDLIRCEFAVLVALEFSLHVPTWEVYPHYQRLLYDS